MAGDTGGHSGASEERRFRLLFVCTGNICRSPTAEILMRHLLRGRLGGREAARFDVSSAGVHAVVGGAMHPMAREQLTPWKLEGVHSAGFVARQLTREVSEGVDLVLGASPHHRSSILGELPELLDRTFSLREFARLVAAAPTPPSSLDPASCARALVTEARALRGRTPPPDDDRIPDPMGGPPEGHWLSTILIFEAVRTILDVLAPRLGSSASSLQLRSPPPHRGTSLTGRFPSDGERRRRT